MAASPKPGRFHEPVRSRAARTSRRVRLVVWLVVAVTSGVVASAAAPPAEASEDAGVHQPAVDALEDRYEGIFDGTGCEDDSGGLCPSEPLQRWEMAVWLVRVLYEEEPSEPEQIRFDDVRDNVWWAAHTERLAELGITTGCRTDPLRYCPRQAVTRGQMATFLLRAFGLAPGPDAGFADVAATHTHAASINALAAAGVTAGCRTDPLRYCPERSVTRGQMATFLARATGIIEAPRPEPSVYAAIAAGGFHTCAINETGGLECWGLDEDGQATPPSGQYTTVAAGGFHTCAINETGGLECWGFDQDGQASAPSGQYGAVAAGGFHTCAVNTSRSIECWGDNTWDQSDPPSGAYTAIAAGWQHTCALSADQTIRCWGNNDRGQADPPSGAYTTVAAGGFHTCAIAGDRSIECWGNNDWDQSDPPSGAYTAIAAGWQHTCALGTDQTIRCWGNDTIRQTDPPTGRHTAITAGTFHNCALSHEGHANCWGNNENGQTNTPP